MYALPWFTWGLNISPITALAITTVFEFLLFSFSTIIRPLAALVAFVRNSVFSMNCEIDNNWASTNSNPSNASQSSYSGKLSRKTIRRCKRCRKSDICLHRKKPWSLFMTQQRLKAFRQYCRINLCSSSRDWNRSSPTICASNACPYNKEGENTINRKL